MTLSAAKGAVHRWATRPYEPSASRIPELNGLRVLLVFIVSWYHFWQQSWLTPHIGDYSLDFLVRAGYMPVDGTILLSGFLLFLPHARSMVLGDKVPELRTFYQRRVMRIVPSYYFITLLLLFFIALPGFWSVWGQGPVKSFGDRLDWIRDTYQGDAGAFLRDWMDRLPEAYGGDKGRMKEDILRHLTFTQTFDYDTYVATPIGVASWTIAIEMQAYLIFPLLARCARRHPAGTFFVMADIALIFRLIAIGNPDPSYGFNMVVNQLPNFLDVYAAGMAAALIYVRLTTKWPRDRRRQLLWQGAATLIAIAAVYCLVQVLQAQAGMSGGLETQGGQMVRRPLLAVLLAILTLALPFCIRPIRFLTGNRLMGFLAMVSMNYYLVHQNLAVILKQRLQLPSSLNYPSPNQLGGGPEQPWANRYMAMCFGLSLLMAILITFLVEKPCAWLLKKLFGKLNAAWDRHFGRKSASTTETSGPAPAEDVPSNDERKA